MRCITLLENTCGNADCIAEHGLCIYVETQKHKLLLDTGQTDAFLHNAKAVGVDIADVDTVVLSHGHYDHSGGILPFCSVNHKAQIYMQKTAAEPHFNGERYIGIDKRIPELPNINLLDGDIQLDDELFLFTGITGTKSHAINPFPTNSIRLDTTGVFVSPKPLMLFTLTPSSVTNCASSG